MFRRLYEIFNKKKNKIIFNKNNTSLEKTLKYDNNQFDYLYDLSHDINTPITAILLCNSVILECIENNNFKEIKEIINNQSISCDFLKLTSRKTMDILNMTSNIELSPNIQSTDLVDIANKSIMMFKCVDTKRKYIINVSKKIPKYILTDPQWIADIILNLLSNCRKFTNDNGGEISLDIKSENNNIYVHVVDNGIGIPVEFESKLFTAFSKFSDTKELESPGPGIGLYMIKKKILLLGGDVGYISKFIGSHFWFSIPIRETLINLCDLNKTENNKVNILPKPLLNIFKICILEEDEITLNITKKIIEKTRLKFDIYNSINKLIDSINNGSYYDIIIISYKKETTDEIHKLNNVLDKCLPNIYKILNLVFRLARDNKALINNNLIIEKPMTKEKFSYCINEFLIKKQWLNILIVEDDIIIQTIFKHILTKIGFVVTLASNGKEGLNKLIENNYFIVFSDLNLPIMNGLEMLKEFNKYTRIVKPYISIITAQNHLIKNIQYEKFANELNSKPFGYNDFIGTIERAIKSRIIKTS